MKIKEFSRLIIVLVLGFLFGTGLTPLHAEDPVVATGEVLKVCINTKTGVLRVANKCTSAERKTVLGGVGAKGEKGDVGEKGTSGDTGPSGAVGLTGATGAQGPQGERGLTGATGSQGPQGFMGATGATGSISSLRTRSITVWDQSYSSFCSSYGFSVLNGNTSLSSFLGTLSLNKSCSTLTPSNVTVYAP